MVVAVPAMAVMAVAVAVADVNDYLGVGCG
jgi:hypothetical protein